MALPGFPKFFFLLIVVLFSTCSEIHLERTDQREGNDPYLTKIYWSLNDDTIQQKLRQLKPFPVGVVYYQQRGEDLAAIKKDIKQIKDFGFTNISRLELHAPENASGFEEQVCNTILESGMYPWYYGMAGWEALTPNLLQNLGIDISIADSNIREIEKHPEMIKYQVAIQKERILHIKDKPLEDEMSILWNNSPFLPDSQVTEFALWLEKKYKTIQDLETAWNVGYTNDINNFNFTTAAQQLATAQIDEFGNRWGNNSRDFRRFRDAMRFQADRLAVSYKAKAKLLNKWDKNEPRRISGSRLLENQPVNGHDYQELANVAASVGSFYTPIRLNRDLETVEGEIIRPVYIQARTITDMFKGGWAAVWESTAGPAQWNGKYGYTANAKLIKQLMLCYIAAGLKGIGFESWNPRSEGWEAGESSLTTLQGEPSERAKIAGNIAKIIQKYRFELWDALDEPVVGILYSWENEAILGRMSMGAKPISTTNAQNGNSQKFDQYYTEAKIGISRTLMNHSIPFEYVTEKDLAAGLAHRYQVIYLPCMIALSQETADILAGYVKNGGRIVADMPVMLYDDYGRLHHQFKGSSFEKVFGFLTTDYNNTFNAHKKLNNMDITGQYAEIELTNGKVFIYFQDGTPAIIQSSYGKGSTTVFNFEAGRMAFTPGQDALEDIIMLNTLGDMVRPQFIVGNTKTTMVFRRSAPNVDHYFVINDGYKESISISTSVLRYSNATDVLSGEELSIRNDKIELEAPAHSARWIRCVKK